MNPKNARLGCLWGMVCGDALGAPYEFCPVKMPKAIAELLQRDDKYNPPYPDAADYSKSTTLPMHENTAHHRWPAGGLWTDDASMGLCLAETLLNHWEPNSADFPFNALMDSFYSWLIEAHNAGRPRAIGLGGVISSAMNAWRPFYKKALDPFKAVQSAESSTPDRSRCDGNGSIMRCAAAAAFASSAKEAMALGYYQSVVTTPGLQSANCSRLLAYLCYSAIDCKESDFEARKQAILSHENMARFIELAANQTLTASDGSQKKLKLELVENLCLSQGEGNDAYLNWRASFNDYQLRPGHIPTYYGSYVMEGMSLALHIVYNSHSFQEALEMAALMCGDADSNAAVVGQLAGAIYGVNEIPQVWKDAVNRPVTVGKPERLSGFLARCAEAFPETTPSPMKAKDQPLAQPQESPPAPNPSINETEQAPLDLTIIKELKDYATGWRSIKEWFSDLLQGWFSRPCRRAVKDLVQKIEKGTITGIKALSSEVTSISRSLVAYPNCKLLKIFKKVNDALSSAQSLKHGDELPPTESQPLIVQQHTPSLPNTSVHNEVSSHTKPGEQETPRPSSD